VKLNGARQRGPLCSRLFPKGSPGLFVVLAIVLATVLDSRYPGLAVRCRSCPDPFLSDETQAGCRSDSRDSIASTSASTISRSLLANHPPSPAASARQDRLARTLALHESGTTRHRKQGEEGLVFRCENARASPALNPGARASPRADLAVGHKEAQGEWFQVSGVREGPRAGPDRRRWSRPSPAVREPRARSLRRRPAPRGIGDAEGRGEWFQVSGKDPAPARTEDAGVGRPRP